MPDSRPNLPTSADDMICLALYRASHAITRRYSPMLRDLGLTYPQWITLTALWEEDRQIVSELSKRLGMESNTLTPLLKRLETLGHITRTRSTVDERQVIIALTPAGRALQSHAPDITKCIIESTGFGLSDLETLVQTLTQLRTEVTKATTSLPGSSG